jgi:hypothetical protein
MLYRISGVVAVIAFAIMMALRQEVPNVAVRAVLAAIAGGLVGVAWWCIVKSRRSLTR